jgi:hypothetical protein
MGAITGQAYGFLCYLLAFISALMAHTVRLKHYEWQVLGPTLLTLSTPLWSSILHADGCFLVMLRNEVK